MTKKYYYCLKMSVNVQKGWLHIQACYWFLSRCFEVAQFASVFHWKHDKIIFHKFIGGFEFLQMKASILGKSVISITYC